MNYRTISFVKLTSIIILAICLFLGSCKKGGTEAPQLTKKELLANKWGVSDLLAPNGGGSVIGLPIDEIKCLKDNFFTLSANDTYTIDEGTVVCNPSSAGSGTWSLIENDTMIKFVPNGGGAPLLFTLVDVNSTTLKVSYEIKDIPLPGIYTIVLTKQ